MTYAALREYDTTGITDNRVREYVALARWPHGGYAVTLLQNLVSGQEDVGDWVNDDCVYIKVAVWLFQRLTLPRLQASAELARACGWITPQHRFVDIVLPSLRMQDLAHVDQYAIAFGLLAIS